MEPTSSQELLFELLKAEDFPVDDLERSIAEVHAALSQALQNLQQASSGRQRRKLTAEVGNLERIVDLSATINAASQLESPQDAFALVEYCKALSSLRIQRRFLEDSFHEPGCSADRRNVCRSELRQNMLDSLDVLSARHDFLQAKHLTLIGTKSAEESIDEVMHALIAIESDSSASSLHVRSDDKSLRKGVYSSSTSDVARWETFASVFRHSFRHIVIIIEQAFTVLHNVIVREINSITHADERKAGHALFNSKFASSYEEFIRDPSQMFAFDVIMCHSSFERDQFGKNAFERLRSEADCFSMTWANSNAQLWFDVKQGPLETAKLFCRSLGANCSQIRKFEDFNVASLLRIMVRCSFFCSPTPISNPSGIVECISKRDTVHGCLEAVKHWSSFGKGNVSYSEHDFASACCLFQDLTNQTLFFYENSGFFQEYLRSTIENYVQAPFRFTDHRSYISSIKSESTFPVVPSSRSERSVSSFEVDDDYQKAILDELGREHQEFFQEEIAATAKVQLSSHFECVSRDPVKSGEDCLYQCLHGIRPFVRMVLRQLQSRICRRFNASNHLSASERRNFISTAFLESHIHKSGGFPLTYQHVILPEAIFEEESLGHVARYFVDDLSSVYGPEDILAHGDLNFLLQVVENCTEFRSFGCFFGISEDQHAFDIKVGTELHELSKSVKCLRDAFKKLDRAEEALHFSIPDYISTLVAGKALLSAIVTIVSHFELTDLSTEAIVSALTSLHLLDAKGEYNPISIIDPQIIPLLRQLMSLQICASSACVTFSNAL
jgi:hypothetical protein